MDSFGAEPNANLQPRAIGGLPSWAPDRPGGDTRVRPRRTAMGPGGEFEEGSIDRFPAWLAGFLVVAYCAVFWVGLITVAGWLWRALTG
ncbi:MAG: hypothetical protein ACF8PN_00400 [Phycisphaerales bacterium]